MHIAFVPCRELLGQMMVGQHPSVYNIREDPKIQERIDIPGGQKSKMRLRCEDQGISRAVFLLGWEVRKESVFLMFLALGVRGLRFPPRDFF
jgi:hypothetical protein